MWCCCRVYGHCCWLGVYSAIAAHFKGVASIIGAVSLQKQQSCLPPGAHGQELGSAYTVVVPCASACLCATALLLLQHAVLLDIYNISQEQGMPIDKLMAMYLPDTTPAFKSWIAGELRKIDEEQQQGLQQAAAAAAYAAQLQQAYAAPAAEPAPGALGAVYNTPAAAGAIGMASSNGAAGGPTMEALKARMSQLQSEKTRMLQASPVKLAAPIAPAAVPAEAAAGIIGIGTGVEGSAGGVRNLQDLRSRMKGLTGT